MKKLFILCGALFLISELFAQQTSTAAIKLTIHTLEDALRKGDSSLLRSVLAKGMELQEVAEDKMGKVSLSTTSADDLVTAIGTPHADVYDELNVVSDIKIDGPMASVRTSYKFYLGTTFDHCGVHYFLLVRIKGSWKIIYIAFTNRKDNCKP